ncbi:hypothetical protein IC229_18460 [Spirosoma sp. BT702]|uniref:Uncharacterized protein n=1 Tax=Spirosoma profusum TaxID=2771354 RepID=A0A926Y445_9BACT|nr:hypothetical protein [Spirosoma profusum]MBD2702636.1 hypothetical protein [Spirosoma profusum]
MCKLRPTKHPNLESVFEVRTYSIDLFCGNCKTAGKMAVSGPTVAGKTPHTCTRCGRTDEIAGDPYPRTATRKFRAAPIGQGVNDIPGI